jgi:hypothetical protein
MNESNWAEEFIPEHYETSGAVYCSLGVNAAILLAMWVALCAVLAFGA